MNPLFQWFCDFSVLNFHLIIWLGAVLLLFDYLKHWKFICHIACNEKPFFIWHWQKYALNLLFMCSPSMLWTTKDVTWTFNEFYSIHIIGTCQNDMTISTHRQSKSEQHKTSTWYLQDTLNEVKLWMIYDEWKCFCFQSQCIHLTTNFSAFVRVCF